MKKFFIYTLAGIILLSATVQAQNFGENEPMKIRLIFDNKTVIVKMTDNSATRQFMAQLPETFEFIDFAGEEKITEFHKPISLSEAPRGMVAQKGKMFIYAPWGNFGFFYKDHGHTLDNSLIELGEIENGLEYLQNQKGGFNAKIEVMEEKQ